MERAEAALFPFVKRWGLPLNPEHLSEIAGAVLEHADGVATESESAEIEKSVNLQLDEFDARTTGPCGRK